MVENQYRRRINRGGRVLTSLIFLLLLNIFSLSAESADSGQPFLKEFMYLEETDSHLSFDDVYSGSRLFCPYDDGFFRFGIIDHHVWIRARISSLGENSGRTVLTINNTGIMEADLYLPLIRDGKVEYRRFKGGLSRELPAEDWKYRYMIYDLPENTADNEPLYFHFNPGGHSANFSIELADSGITRQIGWKVQAYMFIGLGIILGMFLYNGSLYFFIRDRSYIYYVLYIFSMFVYQLCRTGIGRTVGIPELDLYAIPVSTFSFIFVLAFSMNFLDTGRAMPRVHKISYVLALLSLGALIVWFTGAVKISNYGTHSLSILISLFLIIISIIRIRQGFTPARYYLAAWLVLGLTIVMLAMAGMDILPYNFVTSNAYVLGSAIESVLLSMALGNRIQLMSSEHRKMQADGQRLAELSITDKLTGLFNKRGYDEKSELLLNWAAKGKRKLSLLVLDVDRFKTFNDSYGHAEGDRALQGLSQSIRESIRDRDVACRYGGEEFAVILPGSSEKDACLIAERLRKNVASRSFVLKDGREVGCTVSIGVASLEKSDDQVTLFERADEAMYKAKENGRNRVISGSSLICEVELPR